MSTKIQLKIDTCQDCPFFEKNRNYTEDSFEVEYNWHCRKKDRSIEKYVSWSEERDVKVPDWCPIKVKDKKPNPPASRRSKEGKTQKKLKK